MARRTRQVGELSHKTRSINAFVDLVAHLSHAETAIQQAKRLARWFAGQMERTGTIRRFPSHRQIISRKLARRLARGAGVACA